jgi:hypothetical protein
MRDNSAGRFRVSEGEDRIVCAPGLEGADALEVLAFEEKVRAGELIEGSARHDRRAMDEGTNPRMRLADVLEREPVLGHSEL